MSYLQSLHRLEGFYWVARTGGYARAARAFPYPISQPGVHQQVRRLEEELGGVALFERVGRDRVRPTPAGERLYHFCAPFFAGLPAVARELAAGTFGGTLRIDAAALPLRQLLPDWVLRLRRARADVDVELQEIDTPDLERLRTGEADLIVDYLDDVPEGHGSRVLAHSTAYLVLPARHPLARRKRIDLRALAGESLVAYHPSLRQHALQRRAVRERIGEPGRQVAANSVDTILAYVRAGLGYSLIPWLDPRGPRVPGVVARAQRGPGTRFAVRCVWRDTGAEHPLVRAALAHAPSP